ncbi:MAG TPA: methyltransferase domain-containing protein [Blastocatellia bacterium]|nr:methyltransferase domain-containing protein [Blastocatellia bacterium]
MRLPSSSCIARAFLKCVLASLLLVCAGVVRQPGRVEYPVQRTPTLADIGQQREPERITRKVSPPYTGDLSIFEDSKRDEKLQTERVMNILGINEGSAVADIGAGSGWFTVRAARRVADAGTVYAVDINDDYLKHIRERAKRENLSNIRTILGTEDDPLLPRGSVDAVLLLKTYHEVAQPIRLLAHVRQAMRPGAKLGIIDRNGRGDDHGIDSKTVIDEADRAGFELVEQYDFVKSDQVDYFLVFRARPEG